MNLETVKSLVTSKTARQLLLARKHSPKILFVAGTVGVVTSAVLACRATLAMDEVLEESEKRQININDHASSEEEQKKESTKLKFQTAFEIAKLYMPPVFLGAASIAALTGSHVILNKRNGAVMAAYAGLDRAYKEYRQRVANEYGSAVDHKFATSPGLVEVEEKTADGKTKVRTVADPDKKGPLGSPYAVLFDESCPKWSREPGRNQMTLQMNQSWANDKLRANKHLFLNEVFDMLGLPRTPEGQIVGWIYRHDNEPKNGDNYVDFGIFSGDTERAEAFINGQELSVWLDFNVDGPVYHMI